MGGGGKGASLPVVLAPLARGRQIKVLPASHADRVLVQVEGEIRSPQSEGMRRLRS